VVNLKKQSVKAYILLESLVSLALLTALTTIVLTEVVHARKTIERENHEIEALNVAKMALDSDLKELSGNGEIVKIVESENSLHVINYGEEILQIEIKN
jgi:type II secretory pathway pseudopilin PulG